MTAQIVHFDQALLVPLLFEAVTVRLLPCGIRCVDFVAHTMGVRVGLLLNIS
jgi:hypothetical protein